MSKIVMFALFLVTLTTSLKAIDFNEQEIGMKLFAVHATDVFPMNGIAKAGFEFDFEEDMAENFPNFRCTLHFSLGELVRPLADLDTWEDKKYAIVTPLNRLYPQLINLNCYDTFILGDFHLDEGTILVVPEGTEVGNMACAVFEYEAEVPIREAIDAVIASQGGWKVTMQEDNVEEEFAPAMLDQVNINTDEFFRPILDLLPHLSLGLRWESRHGEAWRFASVEMLLMGLYERIYVKKWLEPVDEHGDLREELLEHHWVLSETYLDAPLLDPVAKETLYDKLDLLFQWIQLIEQQKTA